MEVGEFVVIKIKIINRIWRWASLWLDRRARAWIS
jgi:hypothetical protein